MEFAALQKEMIAAMKAHDKLRKDTISSVIGSIKKIAIDEGCRDAITEELTNRMILKEIKTVKEQIDSCPASRTELLAEYQAKMAVLQEYAPKLLSKDEIREILTTRFADLLATKNRGQIMKAVMAELKGKADGKVISQTVAELCR